MKVTYDASIDALYVYLYADLLFGLDGAVAKTEELESGVMIDYLADGRVAGVEILNATEKFPKAFQGMKA